MEKSRSSSSSSKHLKKRPKKSSKKSKHHRRSSYDDEDSNSKYKSSRTSKDASANFKIVEYSDVSSEDFSAPEAGEIQDEENSQSLSDRELIHSSIATGKINNGNSKDSRLRVLDTNKLMGTNSSGNNAGKTGSSTIAGGGGGVGNSGEVGGSTTPPTQRKIIVGSPISSSVSSNSRSKLRNTPSPNDFSNRRSRIRKDCLASPIDIENDDDDDEDDDDDDNVGGKSDDSDIMRKRKKSKKSKKKKKQKKRKKKRNKSISSIENISDNDSVLDDDIINSTPPLRPSTPNKWDKRYTPLRQRSLSKSPITPPLRPNSNMSIYSETSRRTPPLSQKYNASSPHTPPLVPRKSTASYHGDENSDKLQSNADGDVRKSVVYVVDKYYSNYTDSAESHSHYHHHGYSHHSSATHRSPGIGKDALSSSSRRSKSPSKHFSPIFLLYLFYLFLVELMIDVNCMRSLLVMLAFCLPFFHKRNEALCAAVNPQPAMRIASIIKPNY